eukprot:CAMPEP_0115155270 /NCGR_PEP_ID=MMETSP0227-20121206/67795_1 /TAXON_ID=89957 /ORGANISM="Polarella glacialis, Strain CCMP 1383" /LENGTH=217 /DNA_ID=CAMNT_0002566315 /DNA_START=50 /DNA_END=703 /DNA_ORIENTATION=+
MGPMRCSFMIEFDGAIIEESLLLDNAGEQQAVLDHLSSLLIDCGEPEVVQNAARYLNHFRLAANAAASASLEEESFPSSAQRSKAEKAEPNEKNDSQLIAISAPKRRPFRKFLSWLIGSRASASTENDPAPGQEVRPPLPQARSTAWRKSATAPALAKKYLPWRRSATAPAPGKENDPAPRHSPDPQNASQAGPCSASKKEHENGGFSALILPSAVS